MDGTVTDYKVEHGVFKPSFELSKIEKDLFDEFEKILIQKDFKYLAVPVSVSTDAFYRQAAAKDQQAYWLDGHHMLNGSAEQGILDHFADSRVEPMRIYAYTHCFRREYELDSVVRLKEFKKLEQFIFCNETNWLNEFELILNNARDFLKHHNIEYRTVDVTQRDPGYHIRKYDIEIKTENHGWVESHSCSYFGTEQTKRLGITGATHTLSNTGIASPRILIPFIERLEKFKKWQ
jgi:seryl-tRNA synthetase